MVDPRAGRTPLQRWTDAMTVGTYRTGAALARYLPAFVADGLAPPIGLTASFANTERRAMVERHMRRVNPTWPNVKIRAAVQGAFDSYTRYWIESLRLPSLSARTVDAGMRLTGFSHVTDALERGTGAILALPHLGGWEWAAFWLTVVEDAPVTAVVERLDPPELFEWFVQLRSELGMTVVPLGPDAASACIGALRNAEVLCLLSDRDIGGGGIEVDFFGERTTLPAGPATLALRTGAPILPTAIYFDGVGHRAVVRAPLDTARRGRLREDVARITQDLAVALEELIGEAPEQWHLMSPNWPSDIAAAERAR
jgi:lauroyl/myristoyl acyltransferase